MELNNDESIEHHQNGTGDHDEIDHLENENLVEKAEGHVEFTNRFPNFAEAEQLVHDDDWQNVRVVKFKSFLSTEKNAALKIPSRYLLHDFSPQIVARKEVDDFAENEVVVPVGKFHQITISQADLQQS